MRRILSREALTRLACMIVLGGLGIPNFRLLTAIQAEPPQVALESLTPSTPSEAKATPGPMVEDDPEIEKLVEAHNTIRDENELPPLTINPMLNAAARVHSLDMASHNLMAHEGSDGSTPSERIARQKYKYQKVAENVAQGYQTIDAVMEGWMNSPHHRENILGEYKEIGAARVESEDGTPYWTVEFATAWRVLDPEVASQKLVDAINNVRARAGKPPLRTRTVLKSVAMQHAQSLAEADEHAGERSEERENPLNKVAEQGYQYRSLAMAGASAQPDASEVVQTWTNQGDGQVNLLGNFSDVGAGYAVDKAGRPFWTVILSLPLRRP